MTPASAADRAATHIFLVAAEASGDRLGAALMPALQDASPKPLRFSGVGGSRMAAAGLVSLFPIEELAIIGVTAIPRRLRQILGRIRDTAEAVATARPDALVIIDSPDFTHRVARRVRRRAPRIPIVDYVSPSVWAWRPGRARAMRRYVDHVLALLPFEPKVHARLGGPACSYVGHPLIEEVGRLRPDAEESRRRLADPPVLLVLPGSRGSEIGRLLGIFGAAVARLREQYGPLEVVLPTLPHLAERIRAAVADWPLPPRIVTDPAETRAAFRVARAALAKSGTVTLELALAGIPTVAAYKIPLLEELVARLAVRVPSVILANLVLGENVVPEFLQRACTADNLASALAPLLGKGPERQRQLDAMARLDTIMQIGNIVPSRCAAEIVLDLVANRAAGGPDRP